MTIVDDIKRRADELFEQQIDAYIKASGGAYCGTTYGRSVAVSSLRDNGTLLATQNSCLIAAQLEYLVSEQPRSSRYERTVTVTLLAIVGALERLQEPSK